MSNALAPINQFIHESNDINQLAAFFGRYPILSIDEEKALTQQAYVHKDKKAIEQLVLSHMQFVIKVAKGYLNYGLPAKDLVQEGTIGLMKSIRGFVPERGVRLVTYAKHWIKAEIQEYILKNWRLVKVASTKIQKKLFFSLRKTRSRIGQMTSREVSRIASILEVPEKDVSYMAARMTQADVSLEVTADDDDMPPAELRGLESQCALHGDPEKLVTDYHVTQNRDQLVSRALGLLDERELAVIRARYFDETKTTFKTLSNRLGVSIERVRQIEVAALQKMRHCVQQP